MPSVVLVSLLWQVGGGKMGNKIRSKSSVSIAAIIIASTISVQAFAQENVDVKKDSKNSDETIIVVGARKALRNAAEIKKNADTVVDVITANDIGVFPDKSVAEALQRVPGVNVARSAYKDDVMHFSAEPSSIIIRGLPQVRSEFNGRDTFSATSGYGLSWSDVSPELMSGVDTYKNLTAEMIEGGIAGSVNLRTRLPFEQKGKLFAVSIDGSYGDIGKKTDPSVSALFSNRWSGVYGEFGILGNIAYSEVNTTSQGTTLPRMLPFAAGTYTSQMNYIPSGMNVTSTEYDRKRIGGAFAAQWRSPDGKINSTLQYNGSSYKNKWYEDDVLSYWKWVDPASTTHSTIWSDPSDLAPPDGGAPFKFGSDGLFQSGIITGSRGGWGYGLIDWSTGTSYIPNSTDGVAGTYSKYGNPAPVFVACLPPLHGNVPCRAGAPINMSSRFSDETRDVNDYSFNFNYEVSDRLKLNFDAQRVSATSTQYDITYNMRTFANIGLDLTGKYPSLELLAPSGYNLMPSSALYADYRNYSPDSVMDHRTDNKGTLNAFKADAFYKLGNKWFDELRVGVRFADRHQENHWSAYNWASISSDWGTNPVDSWFLDSGKTFNSDGSVRFQGYEPGYYETRSLGTNILNGRTLKQNQFVFIKRNVLSSPSEMAKRFAISGQTDQGGVASSTWNPICERPDEIANSCYTLGEILDIREKTNSAYAMLKFGGHDAALSNGWKINGNIGVRVVKTEIESIGATNFANPFTAADLNCKPLTPAEIAALPPNAYAISSACLAAASVDDLKFSSGGSRASKSNSDETNVLPSLNVRIGLSDKTFVRFAASRAMSKPDIGLLRNYMSINRVFLPQSDIVVGNPNIVLNSSGQPVSYKYTYKASMGNPYLKPIKANQFDLTYENYFAKDASFTATLFYKKFFDYIQNGTFSVPVVNNGVTRNVVVTGPVNGDGASIKGFEVAFTKYFNELPAPFDGLGVQANWTHLKNTGVKNANLIVDTTGGDQIARSALSGMINPGVLENLSNDSANFVVMYEKGKFGARLAYNWRSKYMSSVNDCCLGFPVWNDAEGFLDGSIRYAYSPNIEFNLQANNLLGTVVKMKQQVQGPTDLSPNQAAKFMPGGWFEYDRRIQFGVRFKF